MSEPGLERHTVRGDVDVYAGAAGPARSVDDSAWDGTLLTWEELTGHHFGGRPVASMAREVGVAGLPTAGFVAERRGW